MHHDRGKNKSVRQTKFFLHYIDGIVRTVDGDTDEVLGQQTYYIQIYIHKRDTKHFW